MAQIEKTYDYLTEKGELAYQTVRLKPKDFRARRPMPGGGWAWTLEAGRFVRRTAELWTILGEQEDDQPKQLTLPAVEWLPYRLSELLSSGERHVFLVEGEKDVDTLYTLGLIATTNPFGAGHWPLEFGRYLRGRRCIILPDNDEAGREHAAKVAGSLLLWGAASIRVVNLGGCESGDVSDWISDRLTNTTDEMVRKSLIKLCTAAREYAPCDQAQRRAG